MVNVHAVKTSVRVKSSRGGCLAGITWHSTLDHLWLPPPRLANPTAHFGAQHSSAQGLHERDNTVSFSCTRLINMIFPIGKKTIPIASPHNKPMFMVNNRYTVHRGCHCCHRCTNITNQVHQKSKECLGFFGVSTFGLLLFKLQSLYLCRSLQSKTGNFGVIWKNCLWMKSADLKLFTDFLIGRATLLLPLALD